MKTLRELVSQLNLFCQVQTAFADHIEDHESRVKTLEEKVSKLTKMQEATHTRLIQNEMALGSHTRSHS